MTETTSKVLREWDDPDSGQPDGGWSGPDQYQECLIEGDLADRVRARVGKAGDVTFIERKIEGGYSEFTVEYDYEVTVKVGGETVKEFDSGSVDDMLAPPRNGWHLAAFSEWLAEAPEATS